MPASAIENWSFRAFPSPNGLPLERVIDLVASPDGTVWVATWGSGVRAIRGTQWRPFDFSNGLFSDWIRSNGMRTSSPDFSGNPLPGTMVT